MSHGVGWFNLLNAAVALVLTVREEALIQGCLAEVARDGVPTMVPPRLAEFLLYMILPRRNRESFLGDHNEDLVTNVLPRFGPLLARLWYWWKTILYIVMYAHENLVEPLIRRVLEPLWTGVLWPVIKWIAVPTLLARKFEWVESLRSFLEKHLR